MKNSGDLVHPLVQSAMLLVAETPGNQLSQ